ncbi:cobalamin-dependent protein [Marinilabiliaceae bacterium ANBcel2]|nr:cobalamin-dependent protein [Marinilabiliaceae bacterium ANBcel2]
MDNIKQVLIQFEEALLNLDKIGARSLLLANEDKNGSAEVINKIVVPALKHIGDAWQNGSLALSQIYMSGKICEQLVDELLPAASNQRRSQPKMAIAVLNDYHFLGKRIIYSQIRSAGFEVIDYGRKTVDELVEAVCRDEIEIIFISTLMYPSALDIEQVVEKLEKLANKVKVIVGGAPFNMDEKLWQQVGAYAMGVDGNEALGWIDKLMEGKNE